MYLTPERLEHVLRRHHTGVWDGTFGAYDMQTFFPNGTSYSQIVDWMSKCLKDKELVKEVLLKRNTLGKNRLTFKVDYNGMRFKIGLKKGPNGELIIDQFYPVYQLWRF